MSIQRYAINIAGIFNTLEPKPYGQVVLFSDHEREEAELKDTLAKREALLDKMIANNERLQEEIERLSISNKQKFVDDGRAVIVTRAKEQR